MWKFFLANWNPLNRLEMSTQKNMYRVNWWHLGGSHLMSTEKSIAAFTVNKFSRGKKRFNRWTDFLSVSFPYKIDFFHTLYYPHSPRIFTIVYWHSFSFVSVFRSSRNHSRLICFFFFLFSFCCIVLGSLL